MKSIKVAIKTIVELCICYSWVIIHLTSISYISKLELSTSGLQFAVTIMCISALSLPVYLVYRPIKHLYESRKKDERG